MPALEELRERLNGWELVAEDPEPLLATGLCSRKWLDSALPALRSSTSTCGATTSASGTAASCSGGPQTWAIVPDSGGLAALLAGYFASRAGLPAPPTAPRVRPFQLAQAQVALPWAARERGLSFPR